MCTNWKGFTLKAILLASLSLILYGCGSSSTDVPVFKTVNGVVSDITGGQPFANATVTAYAIDAAGNVATTPLSATVLSDGQGNFSLNIPASYVGGIKLVATEKTGTGTVTLSSVLPSVPQGLVVISPATDMVMQYVMANNAGSFTANNIQVAILVLEPFLGRNFTQIPPLSVGSAPTPAQQQLIAVTLGINSLVNSGTTIQSLLTVNPTTSTIALGEGTVFTTLTGSLSTTDPNIVKLLNQGILSSSYTVPTITPLVTVPLLTDVTPPSAPSNLATVATSGSVTLTWDASTDTVGVSTYYVYRNDVFISSTTASTYIDTAVNPSMTYTYAVTARDTAGNVSAVSNSAIATTLPVQLFSISGRVATAGGSGIQNVSIVVSGTGAGVFVTDANGDYVVSGLMAGSYTITPALYGYTFNPVSSAVTNISANNTGQNFTAEPVGTGTVIGGVTYPAGTLIGGITYPSGTVIGGVTYPTATVIGGVTYPTGTVIGGVIYPNGVVIGGITYPSGTVVGGVAFPPGTVVGGLTYPTGTIIGGILYPTGVVIGNVYYPTGTVIGTVHFL